MLKEFRDFIARGNVLDLAVAVIMGGAFGAVVNSLVNDIIMPPLGLALGRVNFSDLFINLTPDKPATSVSAAKAAGAATINYGLFINTVITFLIVSIVIFFIVRAANRIKRKPEPAQPTDKTCPYCKSKIAIDATRCPYCTSDLTAPVPADVLGVHH